MACPSYRNGDSAERHIRNTQKMTCMWMETVTCEREGFFISIFHFQAVVCRAFGNSQREEHLLVSSKGKLISFLKRENAEITFRLDGTYRVEQKKWKQVERNFLPGCSQPQPAMPGWWLAKQSLFSAQACINFRSLKATLKSSSVPWAIPGPTFKWKNNQAYSALLPSPDSFRCAILALSLGKIINCLWLRGLS